MTELGTILEQARLFVSQHAPPEVMTKGVPLAVVMLLAGIGLCVLGAKLARGSLTAAFVLAGGVVGSQFARSVDLHPLVGAGIGAAAIGTIGFLTFRVWVGVLSSLIVSSIALGVFGYQRVVPYVGEFENRPAVTTDESAGTFTLPTQEQQEAYLERSPRQWAEEFWTFATAKDLRLQPNAKSIGIVAMLAGLLFGLICSRAALILSTAVMGTAIVASAVGMLAAHLTPSFYQALLQRPPVAGAALGAIVVTSLILQTLLTRKAKALGAAPAAKS